ncbi:hypothetical protein PILCRDRAFT_92227 [Piloderma croceum F 1598]|uniref:Uncharacterized protein n=1 Tax=Piloderma croceum (strain F 1598) TaxID=765440 RepID=A0A0C3F5V9_PILCF|nr:hypothetical protein PILCRDRAFT_92227 [Piloderma croceum F 1598]
MSEDEDQTGPPTEEEHIVNCIKAVDNYRGQHISKWEAVTQISGAIHFWPYSPVLHLWESLQNSYDWCKQDGQVVYGALHTRKTCSMIFSERRNYGLRATWGLVKFSVMTLNQWAVCYN